MRLHTGHKDYYDVMQRSDSDPLPRYPRQRTFEFIDYDNRRRLAELELLQTALHDLPRPPREISLRVGLLGFCGKIFPIYLDRISNRASDFTTWRSSIGLPALLDDLSQRSPRTLIEAPFSVSHYEQGRHDRLQKVLEDIEKSKEVTSFINDRPAFTRAGWGLFMSEVGRRLEGDHDALFRLIDAPVFFYRGAGRDEDPTLVRDLNANGMVLERNPVLSTLGWQRHMPPFEAWQKLDMYLGNQMAKQADPLPLSDEFRRDAHGFDDRSFKADAPGARKRRRRENKRKKRQKTQSDADAV